MFVEKIVIGAGGHAKVLLDILLGQSVLCPIVLEKDENLFGKKILGLEILSERYFHQKFDINLVVIVNGIGSTRTTKNRRQVYEDYKVKGCKFESVIHPSSIIADSVLLEEGVQIMAGSIIQTSSRIGKNTICNTGVIVDHDSNIGSHVHLAPGTVLSGNVEVGDCVHIGTGTRVIQGIKIGRDSFVAAGSLVVKDVPPSSCIRGTPAKPF